MAIGRTAASLAILPILLMACDDPAPPTPVGVATRRSCGTGDPVPSPSPSFAPGTAILDGKEGTILLRVEIAQTAEQRQTGLMFREQMAEDRGMVFLFFEDAEGGFYMKNTLLPLSIAYFDVDGKILHIVDMEPCETNSDLYDPGVSYRGALEVNQGLFERWGVEEGDSIEVVPATPES